MRPSLQRSFLACGAFLAASFNSSCARSTAGSEAAATVSARAAAATGPTHTTTPADADDVRGPRHWRSLTTVSERSARAIQQAIDRAGPAAVVVVPTGRYEVDAPIVIRNDDVLLVGASAGSLELGSASDPSAAVLVPTRDDGQHIRPMIRILGARRAQVSGLRFEGIADEDSKTKNVGVQLEDAEDFRVDHAYFAHMGFAGVRSNGTSRGVVDHCAFYAEYKTAIGTEGYGLPRFTGSTPSTASR